MAGGGVNRTSSNSTYLLPWISEGFAIDVVSCSAFALSAVVLLATFIILCASSDKIGGVNVRFKNYIQLSMALLLLNCFLVSMGTALDNVVKCQAMAAIVYYCCHLTASWCLVDILHTFLHNISLTREKKMKLKAKYYMLIGWGSPLLVMVFYLTIHYATDIPVFDASSCWISDGLLFSLPFTVVFLIHVILLIGTIFRARSVRPVVADYRWYKQSWYNFIYISFPVYILIGLLYLLFHRYMLMFEYLAAGFSFLLSTSVLVRLVILEPTVKNSLLDEARREFEANKPITSQPNQRLAYIP